MTFIWVALLWCSITMAQVTFVIEQVPSTTPSEDTIFICGTFNNWNTDIDQFALTRQLDGKYAITLDLELPYFEYKFTRGSFQQVETDENNNFIGNRIYEATGEPETVYITITNWVDLGGVKPVNLWVFYYFTAGIVGILLSILLLRIKKRKISYTNTVATLTVLVSLMLMGRSLYGVVNPLYQSQLVWVLQALTFFTGPLIYLLLNKNANKRLSKLWPHLIPGALLFIMALFRLINADIIQFLAKNSEINYYQVDQIIFAVGLSSNLMYFILGLIKGGIQLNIWIGEHLFKNSILTLICLIFAFGLITLVLGFDGTREIFFTLLTAYIGFQVYFIISFADVFRKQTSSQLVISNSSEIVQQLQKLMTSDKPFKDASLNINDLSDKLGVKSHILSKVLNDDVKQNFRDFVNAYRIDEFIKLSQQDSYKNYTFLALAHEVGFNSKSTFNNAFKKVTNKTPREYFKTEGELVSK